MDEKNAYLRIMISNILELQKKNHADRVVNVQKKQDIVDKFDLIKDIYTRALNSELHYVIKQKHNLEYVFLFEQFNYKVLPIENSIKMCDLYDARLEQVMKYINAKNEVNKSVSKEKTLEYAINSAVVAEVICYYDSKIEEARQYRIMYSKLKLCIDYLEKINDSSYQKYLEILPSIEEVEAYDKIIEENQTEKNLLIDILREQKFDMSKLNLPDLTNKDVLAVINLMYPNFKKELLNRREKGKQVA